MGLQGKGTEAEETAEPRDCQRSNEDTFDVNEW